MLRPLQIWRAGNLRCLLIISGSNSVLQRENFDQRFAGTEVGQSIGTL